MGRQEIFFFILCQKFRSHTKQIVTVESAQILLHWTIKIIQSISFFEKRLSIHVHIQILSNIIIITIMWAHTCHCGTWAHASFQFFHYISFIRSYSYKRDVKWKNNTSSGFLMIFINFSLSFFFFPFFLN